MQTFYLNGGVSTSGVITPPIDQGVHIKDIQLSIPGTEIGTLDTSVTVSGLSNSFTFNSDVVGDFRFDVNDTIYVTTNDFTTGYSLVINYVNYGESYSERSRINSSKMPLPSRLVRNPRNGS